MGICSSCLGSRRRSVYEEDDETRLLFDDPDAAQYGSFGDTGLSTTGDTQDVQRELEALQRVVAHTSDNMVDVFEITQPISRMRDISGVYGPNDRLAQFQSLLSKLSSTESVDLDARIEDNTDIENTIELQRNYFFPIAAELTEPFVGNFADAAKVAQ